MTALISATKSGICLAALPVIVGEGDNDLVRVLGPISDLNTDFYLLLHQDMKTTPRVRAFFDFIVDELSVVRPILTGESGGT